MASPVTLASTAWIQADWEGPPGEQANDQKEMLISKMKSQCQSNCQYVIEQVTLVITIWIIAEFRMKRLHKVIQLVKYKLHCHPGCARLVR